MAITCLLLFLLYMADQVTKYLVQKNIACPDCSIIEKYASGTPRSVEAIPNFLTITHEHNKGMAWSMFDDSTWILVVISAIASIFLIYFCIKNNWKNEKMKSIGVTMALAGCLGNLFDRAITISPLWQGRDGVVDMISFEPLNAISRLLSGNDFPTFNLADLFLVVGLILFAVDLIFFAEKREKREVKNEEAISE